MTKIDDRNSMIEKKIDCFRTDQSKKIDHRFLIGITNIHLSSPIAPLMGGEKHMRSRTFLYEIEFLTTFILDFFSWDAYFWRQRFMCILAHILTQAMLTTMTSLYVAPCEKSPNVFLITLLVNKAIRLCTFPTRQR